jgi:hypothetical protein
MTANPTASRAGNSQHGAVSAIRRPTSTSRWLPRGERHDAAALLARLYPGFRAPALNGRHPRAARPPP